MSKKDEGQKGPGGRGHTVAEKRIVHDRIGDCCESSVVADLVIEDAYHTEKQLERPIREREVDPEIFKRWIGYRDATCDYERSQWGGGTGGGPATLGCLMRLTGEQTLYLEQIMVEY